LSDYVRQDRLIVTAEAVFEPKTGKAEVKQYGQRMGMQEFSPFFKKMGDNATAGELKTLFQEIEKNNPEVAALKLKTTKDGMAEGLRSFEAAHPELCVPIRSDDQFYGVSGGKDKLSKYIQWIYIPAVKNASEEQVGTRNSSLGKLLARTVSAQTNFQSSIEKIAAEPDKNIKQC
jgi:hypothetical protein